MPPHTYRIIRCNFGVVSHNWRNHASFSLPQSAQHVFREIGNQLISETTNLEIIDEALEEKRLEILGGMLKLPNYKDSPCLICLELFRSNEKAIQLACNHTYHKQCINRWLQQNESCPYCRQKVEFSTPSSIPLTLRPGFLVVRTISPES